MKNNKEKWEDRNIINDSDKPEWGAWKIVSDMLDKPDAIGIYPTGECYQKLYKFVVEQKKQAREQAIKEERGRILKALPNISIETNTDTTKGIVFGYNKCLMEVKNILTN